MGIGKNKNTLLIVFVVIIVILGIILIVIDNNKVDDPNVYIDDLVYEKSDLDYNVILNEDDVVVYNEIINITNSGTYIFEGNYEDVVINVELDTTVDTEAVYLVLNNTTISSTFENVINIISAKDVVINVEENTTNYIYQTYNSTSTTSGAAIYSKEDLVINGNGTLYIETNYNDGINSRDDLEIENVTLYITSLDDGIVGKDIIVVTDAIININSEGDGIKSTNEEDSTKGNILINSGVFNIVSAQDSIDAAATLQINDGEFNLESGGGYVGVMKDITVGEGSNGYVQPNQTDISSKSLKGLNIKIYGGVFNISSYEDGIHSDNDLYISSGIFVIEVGDDGIHANNNLVIDDIDLYISNGYEGLEGSSITINGGIIDVYVLDDAINSSSSSGCLTITGGKIMLYSTGDGIDSNGDLLITGGEIIIQNEAIYTMGDFAIDVDGEIVVTGGTIVDENGDDIDYNTIMHSGQNQVNIPPRR